MLCVLDVHLGVSVLIFTYDNRRCVLPEHKNILVRMGEKILLDREIIVGIV